MIRQDIQIILKTAFFLDQIGLYREADLLECCLIKFAKSKPDDSYEHYQNPSLLAESLYKIIVHLMYRSNPDKRPNYLQHVKTKIMQINPLELSNKNPNPSSAIGSALNIVKNMLIGQHPSTIASVLTALQRIL